MTKQNRPPRLALGRFFRNTFATVLKRAGSDSAKNDNETLLEGVIVELDGLNQTTEQGFLAIGGKLVEFHAAALQVSSDIATLSQMMTGEGGRQASQVLTHVLERAKQIEEKAKDDDKALASVCAIARQIGSSFSGFKDTVSALRVLGSLMRIETARLGNAGAEFGNLAEEVDSLTKNIGTSGQAILEASSMLHKSMQSALNKVEGLRAGELKEVPSLIAEVMTSFAEMEERNRGAVDATRRQAEEFREVSAAIEDMITALQFHDITRQQIEHVTDALRQLHTQFGRRTGNGSAVERDARSILALQASQLSNARQVFASSVDRIEHDLDRIAERVCTMAGGSRTLLGASTNEQGSSLLQMESRFTGILKVLDTLVKADDETEATLAELAGSVRRMRDSVGEVRQIEILIRRVAVNATVRAVQIGEDGKALDVIAQFMQRLASDSKRITDEVAADLDAIDGTGSRLSSGSGPIAANGGQGADDLSAEVRSAILEMHSSFEASFSRLNQITALSGRLGDDIHTARAGFSAGTLLGDVISRACSALEQIGGRAGLARGEDTEAATNTRLDDLARHYTTQAEHDVHAVIALGAAISRLEPPPEPLAAVPVEVIAGEEAGMGENVEFF